MRKSVCICNPSIEGPYCGEGDCVRPPAPPPWKTPISFAADALARRGGVRIVDEVDQQRFEEDVRVVIEAHKLAEWEANFDWNGASREAAALGNKDLLAAAQNAARAFATLWREGNRRHQ